MQIQYRWLWNGTNATEEELLALESLRELLTTREGIENPDIVETYSAGERRALIEGMKQDKWRLVTSNAHGYARVSQWARGIEEE